MDPGKWLVAVATGILYLAGCSLKEQRAGCPVLVTVRSDKAFGKGGKALLSVRHAEQGIIFQQLVPCRDLEGAGYQVAAPRGVLTISAIAGYDNASFHGNAIRTENGGEADSLYAFVLTREIRDDNCSVSGIPTKEFSTVNLTVIGQEEGQTLVLNGAWGEVDIFTLAAGETPYTRPLSGESVEEETRYRFRLQRQGDYSLQLDIYDRSRGLLQTLPLGEMMRESWYDARTRPLDDVNVLLDLDKAVIRISVGEWEEKIFQIVGI